MLSSAKTFRNDERGQDLIEYTLLMAFIALAAAALFLGSRQQHPGNLDNRQFEPLPS